VTDAELFDEGVRLFNQQKFFDSHEVLEELWNRKTGIVREELQGLIQVAVALHHAQTGNRRGAAALLARAGRHWATAGGGAIGIDGAALLAQSATCLDESPIAEAHWPVIEQSRNLPGGEVRE
jgi:predicted metal-dependent hydrolase